MTGEYAQAFLMQFIILVLTERLDDPHNPPTLEEIGAFLDEHREYMNEVSRDAHQLLRRTDGFVPSHDRITEAGREYVRGAEFRQKIRTAKTHGATRDDLFDMTAIALAEREDNPPMKPDPAFGTFLCDNTAEIERELEHVLMGPVQ